MLALQALIDRHDCGVDCVHDIASRLSTKRRTVQALLIRHDLLVEVIVAMTILATVMAGHDIPLEPVVLNAQRQHYTEITKSEFTTLKATIQALPN